jgi:hypothetical protein
MVAICMVRLRNEGFEIIVSPFSEIGLKHSTNQKRPVARRAFSSTIRLRRAGRSTFLCNAMVRICALPLQRAQGARASLGWRPG